MAVAEVVFVAVVTLLLGLTSCTTTSSASAGTTRSARWREEDCGGVRGREVTYDHRALVLNGTRRMLFSGEMHYPRSTPEHGMDASSLLPHVQVRVSTPVTRSRRQSLHCASLVSCDLLLDFSRDSDGDRVLSLEDDPMVHEHSCAKLPPKGVVSELGIHGPDNLAVADISDQMAIETVPQVSSKGPSIGDVSDVDVSAIRDATGRDAFAGYATEVEEVGCSDQEEPDRYTSFCAGMFKPIPAPLLQKPVSPPPTSRKHRRRAATVPTRSSARQAARPSTIPVAERAQHKLMCELSFINGKSAAPAPNAAVTAYIDMYGHDLPEQAVKTLRAATRLGDKELSRALAAIAAESGVVDMEVP